MTLGLTRVVAFAAVLTVAMTGWAECARWQVTPEARMACCVDGDACPMHKSAAGSIAIVSQAEADSCCAVSNRDNSTPSSPNRVPTVSLEAMANPVLLVVLPTRASFDFWRALTPLPGTQVPKHLLLSVFLI